MKQVSKTEAFLTARCPRCRRGSMFTNSLASYPFIGQMHEYCPHCGLKFEREPGMWQGAMYTGYALSVSTVIACGIAVFLLGNDPSAAAYIITTVLVALLLAPLNFRYSRVMMMHWFAGVDYSPEAAEGHLKGA